MKFKKLNLYKITLTLLILSAFIILITIVNDNKYLINADSNLNTFNNITYKFQNNSETLDNNNSLSNVLGIYTLNQTNSRNSYLIEVNNRFIDKRAFVLDLYFLENNSPLYKTGEIFSEYCDYYGAPKDCIIVAAIAKHETNLCKYQYSSEMYNCWGFGGGEGHRITFNSFRESIERVTSVLAEQYGYRYMVDPRLMETTFCGPQDECIGWGNRVLSIMNDINNFSIAKGYGSLYDLR